jgi:hypothetical protein
METFAKLFGSLLIFGLSAGIWKSGQLAGLSGVGPPRKYHWRVEAASNRTRWVGKTPRRCRLCLGTACGLAAAEARQG